MDPVQIRMARAALSWDVSTLAEKAGLAPETVTKLEAGCMGEPGAETESETAALRYAFEQAGLMIIATDAGGGPGIRLRRAGRRDEGLRPEQLTAENDG
jgi:DNA-binding XRE family transcriptional regulator